MAFYNSFFNFNTFTPMFNFGCFNMPNFFSSFSSPWGFNNFGFNNFCSNNFGLFNHFQMPFSPSFNNTQNLFSSYTNNSWQNINFQSQNMDTFSKISTNSSKETNWSESLEFSKTKSKTKTKREKETFSYNSTTDINATQNAKYIKNLTSKMQEKTKKLIAYANENGYDVQISSGYRTKSEQKALQEKYKNEPGRVAKNSAHCAGKAIDIKVTKNGQESEQGYNLLGKYAKSELGMRWGGDFTSYRERWHFDYDWA